MTQHCVLVVEDDDGLRSQFRWLLSEYRVIATGDRTEAVRLAALEHPAIAIIDLGLPPDPDGTSEGFATLQQALELVPELKVIVVTGNEAQDAARQAVAAGAYDFFQKPVAPDLLKLMVGRAARLYDLERENRRLASVIPQTAVCGIMGTSPPMQRVLRDVERIARSDIAALITGESGTGKELVANAIHLLSARSDKPFVAINCAAIPESLLEAELFGHEKGAFTGAIKQTIGKIESANGGTLFLDEVGDIPLGTQVKLLRFLEDRIIQRVGGRQQIRVNLRILSATHQDVSRLIEQGRFREDLLYRINEITIHLPPLRDRGGDLLLLANYFLRQSGRELGRSFRGFSREAVDAIRRHAWRGNVRELENRVKRAAVMAESTLVTAQDLDLFAAQTDTPLDLHEARRRAEKQVVEQALTRTDGNISKAAQLLGVSRPTLYDLMAELGLAATRQQKQPTT